jgi:hypothetical protein
MVSFRALHPELPADVAMKRKDLVVIGVVPRGGVHTTVDRENSELLKRALTEDGPDGQDNDAAPEEYGLEPTPAESVSNWTRTEDIVKCLRTEGGHPPIRPGVLKLQSTLGTADVLTFFLAFLPLRHLEDCLEVVNDHVASSGHSDCPPFSVAEFYIFLGVIIAMSNFHGVKIESLWDKEGFPQVREIGTKFNFS